MGNTDRVALEMSQRTRTSFIAIGIASLIVLVFGGIYLYLTIDSVTTEYRSRAELLSWVFADQASFDLGRGNMNELDLLSGPLAFGNVLYAQVIRGTELLAGKSLLESPLPEVSYPNGIWKVSSIKIDGKSIWDICRDIGTGDDTFVRMGLAIAPLQSTIRLQVLLVLGFGLAFIALVALATTLLTRRSQETAHETHSAVLGDASVSGAESVMKQRSGVTVSTEPVEDSANGTEQAPSEVNHAPTASTNTAIHVGDLMIDDGSKRVELNGDAIELSPKEFDLLLLLAQEPGRVYSNQEILDHVWSDSHMATAQDVKQYIYFVRQKLEEDPKKPSLIVTVRGFGYKLQI